LYGNSMFNTSRNSFPKWPQHYCATNNAGGFQFLCILTNTRSCSFSFILAIREGYAVKSHCGLALHFPEDYWHRALAVYIFSSEKNV
jgi:hypothetical protein